MWLIGMMGSGKTTLGSALATEVGVPFFDTDHIVAAMAGMTIAEIWDQHGEKVAAAGGGAVLDDESRAKIAAAPPVVWLRCGPEQLGGRVEVIGRPLLTAGNALPVLERLAREREPIYRSLATHQIDTEHTSLDEALSELIEIWNG
jgi:shikimate kinase